MESPEIPKGRSEFTGHEGKGVGKAESPRLIMRRVFLCASYLYGMTWALFFQILPWALPVLALGWMATLKPTSRFAQKYGINLRAVYCPKCGKRQSRVRVPKDYEEAMFGGSTCPLCGTRMNKYGQKKDDKG